MPSEISLAFISNPAAQVVGFISLVFALLSFQQKGRFRIMLFQVIASLTYSLQYFMMGAIVGGCLDLISFGRTVVFSQRETKRWARSGWWLVLFVLLLGAAGVITGFMSSEEHSWGGRLFWINILAIAGALLSTVALWMRDGGLIRLISLFVGPCWIIYNTVVGSYFGVLSEAIAMISIIVGIIRYDIIGKKKKTKRSIS